jgi:hypothetical protein
MVFIQPFNGFRILLLYFPNEVVELRNCEALGSTLHILAIKITTVSFLHILPQVPHTFSVLYSRIHICHSQFYSLSSICAKD